MAEQLLIYNKTPTKFASETDLNKHVNDFAKRCRRANNSNTTNKTN